MEATGSWVAVNIQKIMHLILSPCHHIEFWRDSPVGDTSKLIDQLVKSTQALGQQIQLAIMLAITACHKEIAVYINREAQGYHIRMIPCKINMVELVTTKITSATDNDNILFALILL